MRRPTSHIAFVLLFAAAGCTTVDQAPGVDQRVLVFPAPPAEPRFVFERMVRSSEDLERPDRKARLKTLLTGETGSGRALAKPFDVTVCRGTVFVSDTVLRSVVVI